MEHKEDLIQNLIEIQKNQNDDTSLKEIILKIKDTLVYLLSMWKLILAVVILGGAIGYIYAYSKKILYTASTTFVLEDGETSGGLNQYSGLASMVGVSIGDGGGLFKGDNIFELYKSRTMIESALLSQVDYYGKNHLLIDRYIEINKLRELWNDNPKLKNIDFSNRNKKNFTRDQDSIISSFASNIRQNYLTVSKPDKKLNIIQVDVKCNDELFAKLFNDQIVKTVNDFYVATKTKKSLANLAIFQQQTDSVRRVLNGEIFSIAAEVDATPNLNPTRQILRTSGQRSQISAETNKAILTQLVQNLELTKISLRKETPLIQIIDVPILPLVITKFGLIKGIFLGSFVFGFLIVVYLVCKRIFTQILI